MSVLSVTGEIVIFRRVFSRPEGWRAAALFVFLAALAWSAWAGLTDLTLSIGRIENPAFRVDGLRLSVTDSKAVLLASRVEAGGLSFSGLRAECGRFSWQTGGFACENAFLTATGFKERLPFSLVQRAGALEINLQPEAGEQWRIVRQADKRIELTVRNGRLERPLRLLPPLKDWAIAGRIEANLTVTENHISGQVDVSEGSFSDTAGEHAAEKLAFALRVDARRSAAAWSWTGELKWSGGEAYWQPFYVKGHGQVLTARGRYDAQSVQVADARLHIPEVGDLVGAGEWEYKAGKMVAARLASAGMNLNRGGDIYLNPVLTPLGVPEMRYGGQLSFDLNWDRKGLSTVAVGLDAVSLHEKRGRFAATGIQGRVPWQREAPVEGKLSVADARIASFALGRFELPLQVAPTRFSVNKAEIPFLDSALVIDRLVWRKSSKRQAWEGDLGLSIRPVPLADLTTTLGLPRMFGSLSASFPHLRYRDNAVYLDGLLEVQVFEGSLKCTHLRLEDPFGTVPRLSADIQAQHINLGQLTETFSFGSITGYADAEIRDIELAAWKPVQFDARLMSSPGSYRKRISQRAVQNISSLGGAGAGAAIQASFLRFFEEFGYETIGLSCRLRGGVCAMGGIETAPNGYVIVKGGGLPALTVIGYNRNVDWTELVDRIQAAIRTNTAPVVQ